MSDYSNNPQVFDDRTLDARQVTKIWKLCPEPLRHPLMNMVYRLDPALHDEVVRLSASTGIKADTSA